MNKINTVEKIASEICQVFDSIFLNGPFGGIKISRKKMKRLVEQFLIQRKRVTFEDINIYHETESAILVELEDQSIWLPKEKIILVRENGTVTVMIPLWLLKKKFPPAKYRQFSKI